MHPLTIMSHLRSTASRPLVSAHRAIALLLLPLAIAALGARPLHAQRSDSATRQPVVMLDVAFYNEQATLREATDTSKAVLANQTLRDSLSRSAGVRLLDASATAAAAASPEAIEAAEGKPCNVIVACARAVGKKLGATWVVMSKISKTSNLIWLLTGQLINVKTGEIVLDDSFEVKGDPTTMVPPGTGIFAQRISKKVRGVATTP
jgi:hypothetical protein